MILDKDNITQAGYSSYIGASIKEGRIAKREELLGNKADFLEWNDIFMKNPTEQEIEK